MLKNISLIGLISIAGCSIPHRQPTKFTVNLPFTIWVMEPEQVKTEYRKRKDAKPLDVGGFYASESREMYVPYSGRKGLKGNYLPRFWILGHELWHTPETGGHYHE